MGVLHIVIKGELRKLQFQICLLASFFLYKPHCYDHSNFGKIKYPFCPFVRGKLTKSVWVCLFACLLLCLFVFSFLFVLRGIIGAMLLYLSKSTVDFAGTNIFLSFNFDKLLYIFYTNFLRVPIVSHHICVSRLAFNVSDFKVIKPLNYEKFFDHVRQCRIRQYCNVILANVKVFIKFLINIPVFCSIMPFRLPQRYQRFGGNS